VRNVSSRVEFKWEKEYTDLYSPFILGIQSKDTVR